MSDLFVGRQPIFNAKLDVIGYELLYRSGQVNSANVVDGDQATMQVIMNTFSEFGLDNLVGSEKAFINLTRNFLMGKYPIPLPPKRVVLEVLEDITIDAKVVEAVQALSNQGFLIALDDVEKIEPIKLLLNIARLVKVDMPKLKGNQLPELVSQLKEYPHIRLLAEKVETLDEFRYCCQLGFDYFQGYFLCKPNVIKRRQLDTSRLVLMRSLAQLQSPKTNFHDLEQIISLDVSLGYKILTLANSAHYSTMEPIKSLTQAISFIGLNQIRAWMTLLLMASVQNKPHELTTIAMQRAKMCELLAVSLGQAHSETFFLVGLFSVLDALMDQPMEEVITSLPVSKDVVDALLQRKGIHGAVLNVVLAYERGDWDNTLTLNIESSTLSDIYLKTIKWATSLTSTMYQKGGTARSKSS